MVHTRPIRSEARPSRRKDNESPENEGRDSTCPTGVCGLIVPSADLLGIAAPLVVTTPPLTSGRLAYITLILVFLAGTGSWRARSSLRLSGELATILAAVALPLPLLLAWGPPAQVAIELAPLVPLTAGSLALGRVAAHGLIRVSRRRGCLERAVIVGAGRVGVDLAEALRGHREYGMEPVGFVDGFDAEGLPLPVLGDVGGMERLLADHNVSRVIVAFGACREPDMVQVFRACGRAKAHLYVVPRFFELGVAPACLNTEHIWGIPLIHVQRAPLCAPSWRMKRALDVTVAVLALAITAPLMAVIAVAVRASSAGPVIFRQQRIGGGGRPVEVLKFRTLKVNTDSDTTWSVVNDDRQTRVGRLLRRTSLDELPQLVNVLRGDMSLVGPRPERPLFVEQFSASISGYADRHRVPVGMTGWAQVHGLRGDTSLVERARFDNHYIEYWSVWTDLVIMARTFSAVVRDVLARTKPQTLLSGDGEVSVQVSDGR